MRLKWEKFQKKVSDRSFKTKTLADDILLPIIYYRFYMSFRFLEMLFDLDESNICRHIKRIELMLADVIKICKNKGLSQFDLEAIRCYGNVDSEATEKLNGILEWKKLIWWNLKSWPIQTEKFPIFQRFIVAEHMILKFEKCPIIFRKIAEFWYILDIKDCKNSIRRRFSCTNDDEQALYWWNNWIIIAHLHRNEWASNRYSLNSKIQNYKNHTLGSK